MTRLSAGRLDAGQGGGEMEGRLQPGTTLEPWRVQFNKDIEAEAKNHPEVELIITDGQDKTEKQVADCRESDRPASQRPADLAEGIGGPDRRGREGDRRQDSR